MKLPAFCIAAACCLPLSATAADDDNRAEMRRVEGLQNQKNEDQRDEARRQHFLYDAEHQPETTGSASKDKDCKEERVRVRRGDGTTVVTRSHKCR